MELNKRRGITVTSIVVYVMLFFMFTTVTIMISSRFNSSLFNDRGNAINMTAVNKLEYNLLSSSNESYSVNHDLNGNKTIFTFSNSDVYEFDLDNNVIYKNGGVLVKHLKDMRIEKQENLLTISVTLNKYTNVVTRTIKLNIPVVTI